MDGTSQLKFSHCFDGVVWSTLAAPSDNILVIEVRNVEHKVVSFSALNFETNVFLWYGKQLEESWWVNASAISGSMVIFTIYMDTNNPDKKGILAYSLSDLTLKWWKNDFSISEVGDDHVKGFTSRLGLKQVILDLNTGAEDAERETKFVDAAVLRPVQYAEGIDYFETVKTFLADRLNLLAVSALEYLEVEDRIIISFYVCEDEGLANYLLVIAGTGDVLMQEKIDGPLKGIGLDTFFVLRGLLIFVKNKVELVSYKIL